MDRQDPSTREDAAGPFDRYRADDVVDLIRCYPLAWITSRGGGRLDASVLPLVPVVGEDGRVVELIGHCARTNPLHAALKADARAAILFNGPQGYVAPEHAGRRDWAPTWNYAQVAIDAEIVFTPNETEASLDVLLDAMEEDKEAPWTSAEIGARYHRMLRQIVGFRVRVTAVSAKFKLGQDERPDTLRHILAHHPDGDLVRWMRRFNADRL